MNHQALKIDHPYTAFFKLLYWFMFSFCIMHQSPIKICGRWRGGGTNWEVFCVCSVLWSLQNWDEQNYQESRRAPSILNLIFIWSLPGMPECLNLIPPLLCPAGKAARADCKASQQSKTIDLTTEGTNLVPEQTIHKISTVIVHKKPDQTVGFRQSLMSGPVWHKHIFPNYLKVM